MGYFSFSNLSATIANSDTPSTSFAICFFNPSILCTFALFGHFVWVSYSRNPHFNCSLVFFCFVRVSRVFHLLWCRVDDVFWTLNANLMQSVCHHCCCCIETYSKITWAFNPSPMYTIQSNTTMSLLRVIEIFNYKWALYN